MIVFLGIFGELATFLGSIAITVNAEVYSVLEIANKGYKVEKSVLDEFEKKQNDEKKQKSIVKEIMEAVLFLIPGINLINASVKSFKLKKSIMNDPQIKEAIVPMTEKEKQLYAKMKGKLRKLTFTTFTCYTAAKNPDEELLGFFGGKPIIVDHGLISLHYEKLMPLNYTLDEVKRLNDATNNSYRIGKIDGKNVAIIGIPNPDKNVSKVHFKSDDNKVTHTYEKMTEEEAKDKTFTVYPFMLKASEEVKKIVDEIKQSRIEMATKANLEALQANSSFEPEVILTENEQSLSEEQQGPRLVKTMYPQNEKK